MDTKRQKQCITESSVLSPAIKQQILSEFESLDEAKIANLVLLLERAEEAEQAWGKASKQYCQALFALEATLNRKVAAQAVAIFSQFEDEIQRWKASTRP